MSGTTPWVELRVAVYLHIENENRLILTASTSLTSEKFVHKLGDVVDGRLVQLF